MAETQDSCMTIISVTDIRKCKQMVRSIMEAGEPVALDAEGVSLGPKGRMTLIQLGTFDGHVYIIDLIDADNPDDNEKAKRLLYDGNLKMLLESDVIKVIHACQNDSGALYHQFGTWLQNVFDTQVAHQVIQEKEGVLFPRRLKIDLLSKTYGGHIHSCKELQLDFQKDQELWVRRPLTQEVLQYAAEDVRSLVPVLYEELDRLVDLHGIRQEFEEQTAENVDSQIERGRVHLSRTQRMNKRLIPVWKNLKKYSHSSPSETLDVLTEDEIHALTMLKPGTKTYARQDSYVKLLVEALSNIQLSDWLKKVEVDGPESLSYWQGKRAKFLTHHENQEISLMAKGLLVKLGMPVPPERPKMLDKKNMPRTTRRKGKL